MKGWRLWFFRVVLWSVFFFLFFLALDLWKATGIYTLERSLSRVLQGKVDIEGIGFEPPLGVHITRFQVDSVLLVREAHLQWFPVFRLRKARILSVYVDLDTWIPRFWGPPGAGPPRAPVFPPLAVDGLYVNEARVRTGGMEYRASGLSGRLAMGGHRMEIPFALRTVDVPFRGRFFNVRGVYHLDYPENRPRHRVMHLEARGLDTLRGLDLTIWENRVNFHATRVVLHEVGVVQGVAGTYGFADRRLFLQSGAVHLLQGETLRNLSGSAVFSPDFRELVFLSGRGEVAGRARFHALEGWVALTPPYAFALEGVADSVWQDTLWASGVFRIEGRQVPPYRFMFKGNRGSLGPTRVEALYVRGAVDPPRVDLDSLYVRSSWGEVFFSGKVDGVGPHGRGTLHVHDLPALLHEWTGQKVEGGEGTFRLGLDGWDRVRGEGFVQYLAYEGFRLRTLQVEGRRYTDTLEIQLNGVELNYGDSLLMDSVGVYVFHIPGASGSWALILARGTFRAELLGTLVGSWPSLELSAREVRVEPFEVEDPLFEGVITDARASFFLSGVRPFSHLAGEVVFREGVYWLDARVKEMRLALLRPFFQRELSGTFTGDVHLVGEGISQEVVGSGEGDSVVFEGLRADRYQIAFRYRRPSLILDSLILLDRYGSLEVTGQILAEPPNLVNLTVRFDGGGTPEANALLRDLLIAEEIRGYGTLQLRGPAASPILSGEAAFLGRDVLLVGTGTTLDSVVALVRTREDTLVISQLLGFAQGGTLEGGGWTRIEHLEPRETRMALRINRFPVEPGPLVFARLTGPLQVEGVLPVLWVRGNLRMDEAYVDARFSKLGGPQRAVEPSPLRLDLHIVAPDGVFLSNELADVEFSADLTVYKPDDINMYLQGTLNALSGTFLYLDRVFDLTQGSIRFQNDPTFNPELFLEARTEVDTYVVYLTVTGHLQDPLFALRSEPPLDTLGILSLLTLGTPRPTDLRQVAELTYLQGRVLTLAGVLLAGRLRREVGLQELAWRSATGEIVVGARIGRNLFLRTWGDPRDFLSLSTRIEYFLTRNRRSSAYFERSGVGRISLGLQYEWEF